MIELPNPNWQPNDPANPRTLLVYRTWTQDDVKKAVEGITSYREDVEKFCTGMTELQNSYHLNGIEVEQAYRAALTVDWAKVRGDWNGFDGQNPPRPLPQGDAELQRRVGELLERIRTSFRVRADYGKIGQTKQKPDEPFEDFRYRLETVFRQNSGLQENDDPNGPYQQQLKNASVSNCKEDIHKFIVKHCVDLPTKNTTEITTWGIHAEKMTRSKQKQTTIGKRGS